MCVFNRHGRRTHRASQTATRPVSCVHAPPRTLHICSKPPILPLAKSKRYTIVQLNDAHPDDAAELLWRRNAYMDAIAALRAQLRTRIGQADGGTLDELSQMRREEMREFEHLLIENQKENKATAEKRAAEEDKRRQVIEDQTVIEVETHLKEESLCTIERTAEVKRMIEASSSWVTKENLLAKIDEALENPISFEYAIDAAGVKYPSKPEVPYLPRAPTIQRRMYEYSLMPKREMPSSFEHVAAPPIIDDVPSVPSEKIS